MRKYIQSFLIFLLFVSGTVFAGKSVRCIAANGSDQYANGYTIYSFISNCTDSYLYNGGTTTFSYSARKKNNDYANIEGDGSGSAAIKIGSGTWTSSAFTYTKGTKLVLVWPSGTGLAISNGTTFSIRIKNISGYTQAVPYKSVKHKPIQGVTCQVVTGLNFGTIASNDVASTSDATLPADVDSLTNTINLASLIAPQRMEVDVNGEPGRQVKLTFPSSLKLSNGSGSGSITVSNFTSDQTSNVCTLTNSGTCTFMVGAKATLSASHQGGSYSGSSNFSCNYV